MTTPSTVIWSNETTFAAALWSVKADLALGVVALALANDAGPFRWLAPQGEADAFDWLVNAGLGAIGVFCLAIGILRLLDRTGARQTIDPANVVAAGRRDERLPVAFVAGIKRTWTPFGSTLRLAGKGRKSPLVLYGVRDPAGAIAAIRSTNDLVH